MSPVTGGESEVHGIFLMILEGHFGYFLHSFQFGIYIVYATGIHSEINASFYFLFLFLCNNFKGQVRCEN